MASQPFWRFLCLVLAVLLGGVEGGACPFGFMRSSFNDNSCYWFSHNTASFWRATTICRLFDSHLAVITSKQEDDFIRNYAIRHGKGAGYWLGATDVRVEGIWTWEYPFLKMNYSNWFPGNPDNYDGVEHCLDMYQDFGNYEWNDAPCTANLHFVCEKTI